TIQARREGETRQAIESGLAEVSRFQEKARWDEARVTLRQTASRLTDGEPSDLQQRLDSAQRDLELVVKFDSISQKAAAHVRQGLNFGAADQETADSFREAGLGIVGEDPRTVAERVRGSAVHASIIAALDYWALCARDPAERTWVLSVLREADPDPWRSRARDPLTWSDMASLAQVARDAPLEHWTPSLLAVVGGRLHGVTEGQALLLRAEARYPDDFWINFALGF